VPHVISKRREDRDVRVFSRLVYCIKWEADMWEGERETEETCLCGCIVPELPTTRYYRSS
jgi:hypothetical protein